MSRPSWEIHADRQLPLKSSPASLPTAEPSPIPPATFPTGDLSLQITKALLDDPIAVARIGTIAFLILLAVVFAFLKPRPVPVRAVVDNCPTCQEAVPLDEDLQPIDKKATFPDRQMQAKSDK